MEMKSIPQQAVFASRLTSHLKTSMIAVDDQIHRALSSDVALVSEIASYIVGGGGKRMRPALTLLCAEACACQRPDAAHAVAAIIELIHTATLLHDDVVDESALRRGNATANANFGNAASVLVGDFLYSRAFQMMVETGEMRVLEVLADATNVIAEGEVHQLINAGRLDLTEDEYLHVVRAKTAKLFEAAGRLGAIISDAPTEIESAMARFGAHLGTAFQIADDVLDYEGDADSIGKNLGDDLAEGKLTLPIIRALEICNPEQRETLRKAIVARDHTRLSSVLSVLHDLDAIAYARNAAAKEAQTALAELAVLEESPAKQLLLMCCNYAVERQQ